MIDLLLVTQIVNQLTKHKKYLVLTYAKYYIRKHWIRKSRLTQETFNVIKYMKHIYICTREIIHLFFSYFLDIYSCLGPVLVLHICQF